MKNLIFFLFIILSNLSFSQVAKKYGITKDELTDFVVIEIPGKTKDEIYKKTVDWISKNFKNSKEVIQSQIAPDFIRFEGYSENFNGSSNALYVIEISFKDGKYKFDPTSFTIINGINKYDFFSNYKSFFKSDGSVKDRLLVTVNGVIDLFNGLNESLEKYVMDNQSPKKDDW